MLNATVSSRARYVRFPHRRVTGNNIIAKRSFRRDYVRRDWICSRRDDVPFTILFSRSLDVRISLAVKFRVHALPGACEISRPIDVNFNYTPGLTLIRRIFDT